MDLPMVWHHANSCRCCQLHKRRGNDRGQPHSIFQKLYISVADPDPGSSAFLPPEFEILDEFFPDP
jgi:hypothetical protein